MTLTEIIDLMEEEIEGAKKALMSSMHMMDQDRMLGFIDEIRESLPAEIENARRIKADEQRILEDARAQADHIIAQARLRAEQLCQEHEIVRAATERAEAVMNSATRAKQEMRAGAMGYAQDVLDELEEHLADCIETIRKNRQSLTNKERNRDAEGQEKSAPARGSVGQ
ncbi:MAG: hypothetical protein IJP30_03210 [Clostridia bacterium]|nr:hypothetical protein [Clostridia bacterium]